MQKRFKQENLPFRLARRLNKLQRSVLLKGFESFSTIDCFEFLHFWYFITPQISSTRNIYL